MAAIPQETKEAEFVLFAAISVFTKPVSIKLVVFQDKPFYPLDTQAFIHLPEKDD